MNQVISFVFFLPSCIFAHFQVIVLGSTGGPGETNNSAYLVGAQSSNDFIAFDAGTILHGLEIAVEKGAFSKINKNPMSPWSLPGEILQNHIQGYLISHPHLDHVAGLILNSTCDSKKPIYALNATIDAIRDHLFNGIIWPNFGSEGNAPILHQYDYKRVKEKEPFLIPNMQMQGQAFILSHPDGYVSTAFLIKHEEYYILYCGDTAPDSLEKQKNLEMVWREIAPIIRNKKLSAIFLECSYCNHVDNNHLYGHLKPHFLFEELNHLAKIVDPNNSKKALENLKVLVTHIKHPPLKQDAAKTIQNELYQENDLGVELIFLHQGDKVML